MRKTPPALAAALVVAGALAITTAAGAQQPAQHQHQQSGKTTPHSQMTTMPAMDDAQFAAMMTMHHQHGIEMTKIEEAKGARTEVKALASKIRSAQEQDIEQMKQAVPAGAHAHGEMQGTAGHGTPDATMRSHHEMMEKMRAETKKKIEDGEGGSVDAAFLSEMAMHHEMALKMIANARLKNPELKKLAEKMAANQKAELAELKKLQTQ